MEGPHRRPRPRRPPLPHLNRAAEVLLDPASRAAYDDSLAPEPDPEPDSDPTPVELVETSAGPDEGDATPVEPVETPARTSRLVAGGCALLALTVPSAAAAATSTREAQSTAERAIVPILSYDAAHLTDDQAAAEAFMTATYKKQYAQLFEVIEDNAPRTETVVTAEVVASGVVRSGDDRVSVLIFVDRPTTNKRVTEPVVYKDQITVTMQKVDGSWLVDDLVTSPAA